MLAIDDLQRELEGVNFDVLVGEVVKILFVMELAGLEGRKALAKYDVYSTITYEGK